METMFTSGSKGEIKARLSELKEEKARLGKAIAQLRNEKKDITQLTRELSSVSAEIKDLQKSLKKSLNTLPEKQPKRWQPSLDIVPEAIRDNATAPCEIFNYFSDWSRKAEIDQYVTSHEAASIWHTPSALDFIVHIYGHSARYLVATDESNKIIGVFPLVQLNSRLFGNLIVSTPYYNYGGILADSPEVARRLLEEAIRWRNAIGSQSIELRHVNDSGLNCTKRQDKLTFWLPLPAEDQILWDSFQPKVRAQIRRGEKQKPDFLIGKHELLDEFYRVFSRNMRDLGTPVYEKAFFSGLLNYLSDNAWLVVVRMDRQPVGCAFITGFRGRMEIPWASTLREYNYTGINMMMYWRILKHAVSNGYQLFDFGRCSKDAGTYRFKQQWGAVPVQLNWDYALSEGAEPPGLNPDNPKFQFLIGVWKRLPVWVSRLIGPPVVKYLP
ncbi:FemAB family XrtA/PEP-CTERM system-associated protein [Marinobacter nauticus]|uniref:FemAB family XrtA/PEP-CTERM system-associated protein n=1 Tax=Marinobacter nauticus TaxID=2743 RepID=UPI001CD488CD|nr:FemAB family XrtA/PEP-CTERM system-associated protein [Marinobacter nauticus]MCA0911884.1 FemAB family PEP-CTERM system-associated protein [Marinobacter nauticus]